MSTMQITATRATYLKKAVAQASTLADNQRVAVQPGRSYTITAYHETEDDEGAGGDGHSRVDLGHGAGSWYIFNDHWRLPWDDLPMSTPSRQPEWNTVNWSNFGDAVSKYFTVGEVTNMSRERIPTDATIQQNIIRVARLMDQVREWWGSALGVNSWYRPWHVNRRIGSSAPNHPNGYAVDFRPLSRGSVWDLQSRFEREWYDTGRWPGGFGRGANKGFIHVDLRGRRKWNY
jgi:hypothetical protein